LPSAGTEHAQDHAERPLHAKQLAEIVRGARLRTPADIAIEVERRLRHEGTDGFSVLPSADIVAADRESH
jgi:hypothetical protein